MIDDANYFGLAAETYDMWFSGESFEDQDYYRRRIQEVPGVALEVGCGTGRLLIHYLKLGLNVEGVDNSDAMLKICERKAEQQGLNPILYKQYMQELDLPHRYNTIYIPFGSFMLVTNRGEAFEALNRFVRHLAPGGQLIITTYLSWGESRFIPVKDLPAQQQKTWTLRRVGKRSSDGALIVVQQSVVNDYIEQIQRGLYRYEAFLDGELIQTFLQPMNIRWYSKYELALMLEKVGLHDTSICGDYTDQEASEAHSVFVYRAWK
jgi:ubiquinone/menaquinone biosynthesis C-methylase UbiE